MWSQRVARFAGELNLLFNACWKHPRWYSALLLLLLIHVDTGVTSTAMVVYAISALFLDLFGDWRDRDLLFLLQVGRQFRHYSSRATPPVETVCTTGHAFTTIACWMSLIMHLAQMIAILIIAGEIVFPLTPVTLLVLVWRIVSAVCDQLDEIGRACIIFTSSELIYVGVQLGPSVPLNLSLAATHPEQTPTYGYRFFVLKPKGELEAPEDLDASIFGIDLLDKTENGS